jgi:hypothetical protein
VTDPSPDDPGWFRAAVAPVLDAHAPRDRWADLRRQVEDRPPLVVALVPRRRGWVPRGPSRWLAVAALALLVAVGALLVAAASDPGGSSSERAASSVLPRSSVPPLTATTGTTRATTPAAPLVEVPAVQRRVDLAAAGLEVRYVDLADAAVPEGAVVSQTPAPGERVPEGSLVVVVMSGGGPVTTWGDLPPRAKAFTDDLADYQRSEPIRRVLTAAGEAWKTDGWLFGPCGTMPEARAALLDPTYDERCY